MMLLPLVGALLGGTGAYYLLHSGYHTGLKRYAKHLAEYSHLLHSPPQGMLKYQALQDAKRILKRLGRQAKKAPPGLQNLLLDVAKEVTFNKRPYGEGELYEYLTKRLSTHPQASKELKQAKIIGAASGATIGGLAGWLLEKEREED